MDDPQKPQTITLDADDYIKLKAQLSDRAITIEKLEKKIEELEVEVEKWKKETKELLIELVYLHGSGSIGS